MIGYLHIKYDGCVSCMQAHTRFHFYMIAHEITCRNSSIHTVAIAYRALTNNVNIMYSFLHLSCPVIGNSFCMTRFWGPLSYRKLRALNVLRPALLCRQPSVTPNHISNN